MRIDLQKIDSGSELQPPGTPQVLLVDTRRKLQPDHMERGNLRSTTLQIEGEILGFTSVGNIVKVETSSKARLTKDPILTSGDYAPVPFMVAEHSSPTQSAIYDNARVVEAYEGTLPRSLYLENFFAKDKRGVRSKSNDGFQDLSIATSSTKQEQEYEEQEANVEAPGITLGPEAGLAAVVSVTPTQTTQFSKAVTNTASLLDHLKDLNCDPDQATPSDWQTCFASHGISDTLIARIAPRANMLHTVLSSITANPREMVRPAVKAQCWAILLADLGSADATEVLGETEREQLRDLAEAARAAIQNLRSTVDELENSCRASIAPQGYVKATEIYTELTSKGMASLYAERVAGAFAQEWASCKEKGAPSLTKAFAAQLKQQLDSSQFQNKLAKQRERCVDAQDIFDKLMGKQRALLETYCAKQLGIEA